MRRISLFFVLVTVCLAQEKEEDVPNLATGKEIFRMCSGCHNTEIDARKMGPSLRTLYGKVLLRNGKRTNDANVKELILQGYNGMPAYQNMLRPGEIDHLLVFLKTLRGRPAAAAVKDETVAPDGKQLFAMHCNRCHGPNSTMIDRAGDLKSFWTKSELRDGRPMSSQNVQSLIDDGHGGAPKFKDWLNWQSRRAMVDYLQTLAGIPPAQ